MVVSEKEREKVEKMGVKVYSIEALRMREPKVGLMFSAEQGMKKVEIIEPRFRQKEGSVFPKRRKLVKKMILESIVKSASSILYLKWVTKMSDSRYNINDVIKGSDVFTINNQRTR
ncbi:hypothetical protein DITRI_Ditri05aG0113100 [Diplodiscus trichospermus]